MQRDAVAQNLTEVFIPYYRQVRQVVELPDGGLQNPMPIIFDSMLGSKPVGAGNADTWQYPVLATVTRPIDNTSLCYMTVCGFIC